MEIYPLTITMDRYGGSYSRGEYLAWRLDAREVPEEPFMDDVTCEQFWDTYQGPVGIGDTPELAVDDLKKSLLTEAVELYKEYGGSLNDFVTAIELCNDTKSAIEWVRNKSKLGG